MCACVSERPCVCNINDGAQQWQPVGQVVAGGCSSP